MSETTVYDGLKRKYREFVDYYLESFNAGMAAKRAGFSQNYSAQSGWELMQREDIQAALDERVSAIAQKVRLSPERIIEAWSAIAFADLADFIDMNATKITVKDLKDVPSQLIQKVVQKKGQYGDTFEVTLYSRSEALDRLSRIQGMYNDSLELKGDVTLAKRIKEARDRTGGKTAVQDTEAVDDTSEDLSFFD